MLSSLISRDARVAKLSCLGARLLFTWMIAHSDNCGRLRAEPAYVRALVLPHEPNVTDQHVADWLSEMHSLGLVQVYEVDGGRYLEFAAWTKHQRLDRMKHSDLPPPPVTDRKPLVAEVEVDVEVESDLRSEREQGRRRGTGEGEPNTERRSLRSQGASSPSQAPRSSLNETPHPQGCTCEICFSKALSPRSRWGAGG